ncbi:MAG: metallophosphoesterase family protein [Ignavibacteriae bacterium]|nr:metallophosphoesterase family protein [Ignavibacteriota bacterium]
MRLAIISDIHSNLEALSAVLEDIDRHSADRIICLGDVVGYGADPSACMALLRGRGVDIIMGNHDEAAFSPEKRRYFSENAAFAIRWTAKQLGERELDELRSLPYRISFDGMLFVHSTPRSPERWDYLFSGLEARSQSAAFRERLCFVGHSHQPAIFSLEPAVQEYSATGRFIINPGSVGQPRDGDWRASYGLLDTVAATYDNHRVDYDVAVAARKIVAAGLPRRLAERLLDGR